MAFCTIKLPKPKEIELQPYLHRLLSDPSKVWITDNNKHIQILSPGILNKNEGPDFNNAAILSEGNIIIGDIEYDLSSDYWYKHGHNNNPLYSNVILHIVSDITTETAKNIPLLKIAARDIQSVQINNKDNNTNDSTEELQHFALIRLLRKSADCQIIINESGIEQGFYKTVSNFLNKYNSRRRRPLYTAVQLENLIKAVNRSIAYKFITKLLNEIEFPVLDELMSLLKIKILDEGAGLRREIVLNCILPFAICIASNNHRSELFSWYWSTKSFNTYGVLKKRFPNETQDYLWQQQAMLEYIALQGRRSNIIETTISEYSFADLLKFYKIGILPSELT